jgi:predicted DNA-binding protein (UPF0251 family)
MARPRKWRNVCRLPEYKHFGPLNEDEKSEHIVAMSVDEFEAIRLIDLDGFTQEESAVQMNVARTTVQGIYQEARRKLADALVNGKEILIDGGDYHLCDGRGGGCGRGCRGQERGRGDRHKND